MKSTMDMMSQLCEDARNLKEYQNMMKMQKRAKEAKINSEKREEN